MCTHSYKQENKKLEREFHIMESIEKILFKENIESIAKSIQKGEETICKLFHKNKKKK